MRCEFSYTGHFTVSIFYFPDKFDLQKQRGSISHEQVDIPVAIGSRVKRFQGIDEVEEDRVKKWGVQGSPESLKYICTYTHGERFIGRKKTRFRFIHKIYFIQFSCRLIPVLIGFQVQLRVLSGKWSFSKNRYIIMKLRIVPRCRDIGFKTGTPGHLKY